MDFINPIMNDKFSPGELKSAILLIGIFFFSITSNCQVNEQSNHLLRSTVGKAAIPSFISSETKQFAVLHSIGQMSVIGTFFKEDHTLRQGFIQPNLFAKIVEEDIPLDLNSLVYPNPFEEEIQILFSEVIEGNIEIAVYSLLGSMILSKKVEPSSRIVVSLNNLASASYILKVKANNKLLVKSIIKR
jgi:hypothetical protein